jgi:hypothetical protein
MNDMIFCALPSNKYKQSILRKAYATGTSKQLTVYYSIWLKDGVCTLCEGHKETLLELDSWSDTEVELIKDNVLDVAFERGWVKVNITEISKNAIYPGMYFAPHVISSKNMDVLLTLATNTKRCLYSVNTDEPLSIETDDSIKGNMEEINHITGTNYKDWIGTLNETHPRIKLIYEPLEVKKRRVSLESRLNQPEL